MAGEEQVALVDEEGRPTGSAPRSAVRRDNLLHSATAILVRNPRGEIYLHRRPDIKDWAPGHWDVAAGGVIAHGEDPHASAATSAPGSGTTPPPTGSSSTGPGPGSPDSAAPSRACTLRLWT